MATDGESDCQRYASLLESSGDYRVIRRFQPVCQYHILDGSPVKIGLIVDTETTGLEADASIIELGMVRFEFCPATGRVFNILDRLSWFEDPGKPLTDEVKAVTGITDEMLVGQRIDDNAATLSAWSADVVIAHNAGFDRPLLERRLPVFSTKHWACTASQIDWRAEGVESSKLALIAYRLGFFFDAHRALSDCEALLHATQQLLPVSGRLAMSALLEQARKPTFRVWAIYSPFEMKDALKARGYRWSAGENGRPKAWYRDAADQSVADDEFLFLTDNKCKGQVVRIGGRDTFSERAFSL